MSFRPPPATACWQHCGARSGFEVAYFVAREHGWRIDGTTTAIEDAQTWVVTYRIEADAAWATRSARITARTATGRCETLLESDGVGRWLVDGRPAPYLDGCMDVDLESSAMTNTLPVHRLDLQPGARADAPAAYVRALTLTAHRLDQVLRADLGRGGTPSIRLRRSRFRLHGLPGLRRQRPGGRLSRHCSPGRLTPGPRLPSC